MRTRTGSVRTRLYLHTRAGEANEARVHCREPVDIAHFMASFGMTWCPAFATGRDKFLPDVGTPKILCKPSLPTGPKEKGQAQRDCLLALLNATGLA